MLTNLIKHLICASICLLLSFGNNHAQSIPQIHDYPNYNTVVQQFFEQYHVGKQALSTLHFARKKAGWYVITGTGDTQQTQLFWDKESSVYHTLSYTKGVERAEKEQFFAHYYKGNYSFNRCLYYGYNSWDTDMIRDFGNITSLPDTLLEGLARAYSHLATNHIRNQFGTQATNPIFKDYGYESLPDTNMQAFKHYAKLSIATYERLMQQNALYETIVGNISTKTANEYMSSYFLALSVKEQKLANTFLRDNLYNDFMLSMAKNYLNSCAKNAILFTQGDSDTYPLWYVQQKYNYRPDVLVININLLLADWYVALLRDKVQAALPLTIAQTAIAKHNRDVAYYKAPEVARTDSIDFLELPTLLNILSTGDDVQVFDGYTYPYYPYKKVHFALDKKHILATKTVSKNYAKRIPKAMQWELPSKQLYKNQLLILDIIATNNWNRPLYFALSISHRNLLGLDNYLQLEGLAYRLSPLLGNTPINGHQKAGMNTAQMYTNLTTKFKIGTPPKQQIGMPTNVQRMSNTLRNTYAQLASRLLTEAQKDEAITVLQTCEKLLPNSVSPYDLYAYYLIQMYYQAGLKDKAAAMATQTAKNLQTYHKRLGNNDKKIYETNLLVLKDLIRLAKNNQQAALEKILQKISDELSAL